MLKKIKLAVIIEKNANLRDMVTNQISAKKIKTYATPLQARHLIVTSRKPGLLIIGNSHHLEEYYKLVGFCRARLANWTVIVLDHLNSDESAAQAFQAGADDVLHVPFSTKELIARVELRSTQSYAGKKETALNTEKAFKNLQLTHTELEIMSILISHKGKIVTRNQLSRRIDNQDWIYGDRKYDVHITNIRKKLKDDLNTKYIVKSVRSVGYYAQETNTNNTE